MRAAGDAEARAGAKAMYGRGGTASVVPSVSAGMGMSHASG